jgi:hypothetical protein
VPFFVEAVSQGRSSKAVESIGGVLTGAVCVQLFENLQQRPNEPADVPLQVETQPGQLTPPKPVSLPNLTTPPAQPSQPKVSISTMLQCGRTYDAQNESFLLQLCYDGLIMPRSY